MSSSVEECVHQVVDVVPFVMRSLRAEFRSHRGKEVNIPQYRTLMYLRRTPGASLSEVAEHLGITLPSTSKLVNVLVERGLIDRQSCPADRRRITLMLTPKGQGLAETSLRETQAAYVARFAAGTAATRARIIQAMEDLRTIFGSGEQASSERDPEESKTPEPQR
jgi:DNA-binding MarR family transcriptional regulator